MRILALLALFSLAGCATLERGADQVHDFAVVHPVVTAVAASLAVGAIVSAVDHHHHPRELIREPRHGLRTHCAPVQHGDVLLPPDIEQVCP